MAADRLVYEFGAPDVWELDPARAELRRGGAPVALRPKPFAVLHHLILHRERYVAKQELFEALWTGVTVSETALTSAVKAIRRALGDDGERPRFVESKRGRGYRFAAEVRERRPAPGDGSSASAFLGRQSAMAVLEARLEAALSGRGSVVLVRGEAGIGKTRLLAELAAQLVRRGIPHAIAWCAEESAAPPFWPWTQVLRRLDAAGTPPAGEGARPLLAPAPAREEDAGASPDPAEERHERFRLFDAICQRVRAAAERDGLVLLLDDLHAADDASLRLLSFVIRRIHDARILLIAAVRDPSALGSAVLTETQGALARLPHGETLELPRLTPPDARTLALHCAGKPLAAGVLDEIVERSRGNPFYLRELASAAAREAGSLPAAVRDALRARFARLPPACNEALAVGAVVGEEFSTELVARVLGATVDEVAASLAPAVQEGLLRESAAGHRFDHAVVAETVRAELGRVRLMRLHLRVGEALESDASADPDRLARHFAAAPESAAARAAEHSYRAGRHAMQVCAFENAAAHFERAIRALELEASPDLGLRAELLTRLGEARSSAGEPLERVARALDEAIEIARRRADGAALGRALLGYLGLPAARPDLQELNEEALRLRPAAEDATTVGLLARLASEHHFHERPEQARSHAERASVIAERLAQPAPVCRALTARLVVGEGRDPPAERLALARRVIEESERARRPALAVVARWKLFFARLERGEPDAGREVEAFARFLEASGNRRQRPILLRQRGALAFLAGDLDGARGLLREAQELAASASNPTGIWLAALGGCLCVRERGDPEAATQAYLRLRERVPSNRHSRFGLVDAHVRAGRVEEARAELGTLDPDEIERAPHLSGALVAAWLADAARSLRDPGLVARLSAWIEPALGHHVVGSEGALWFGAAARYAGLLAWAAGRLDEAVALLRRALSENASASAALFREHSRCDLARVLFARAGHGDRAEAFALLEEAEAWARERPVGALQEDLRGGRRAADRVIPLRGHQRA